MRQRRRLGLAAFFAALGLAGGAAAEDPAIVGEPEPQLVEQIRKMALDNMELAPCEGEGCGPATQVERLRGLLPTAMTREVMNRGAGSAFAKFCGLDWGKRSFLPLLEREERSGCWSKRQMQAISVTHGLSMSLYGNSLQKDLKECNEGVRQGVEKYLLALQNHNRRNECPTGK